jgi:uncharacterized protein YfiM (DUF2279 family)
MLVVLRLLLVLIAAPALLIALVIFSCVENQPVLNKQWVLEQQDIARAKEILNNSNLKITGIKSLDLTEKDLNIALNYLLNNYLASSSEIELSKGEVNFIISLQLPANHFGSFINIGFTLIKQNHFPAIKSLSLGKLSIADEFASLLIENIIKHTKLKKYYVLFSRHINHIDVTDKQLHITYQLTTKTYQQARQLLTRGIDNHALVLYHRKLQKIISQHDKSLRLSLSDLLQPLFQFAYRRSTMDNAIEENRVVILILSAYVNRHTIEDYLPDYLTPSAKQIPVYLYQRTDMAKHFMGSAVLTSSGNGTLAHFLGLEKELQDLQQGSGFSFVDLAADRAGMYFGELATSSPESARIMQKAMSEITDYQAFMPEVRDLPENMHTAEFKLKYSSIYSQQYQKLLEQIDTRILACAIYREQ